MPVIFSSSLIIDFSTSVMRLLTSLNSAFISLPSVSILPIRSVRSLSVLLSIGYFFSSKYLNRPGHLRNWRCTPPINPKNWQIVVNCFFDNYANLIAAASSVKHHIADGKQIPVSSPNRFPFIQSSVKQVQICQPAVICLEQFLERNEKKRK